MDAYFYKKTYSNMQNWLIFQASMYLLKTIVSNTAQHHVYLL